MKAKVEATLDDLEDALEREKKARLEQERSKRKFEADVKSMQVEMDAIDRNKREAEASTARKEKEIASLVDKLNGEQANFSRAQKQIKECGVNVFDACQLFAAFFFCSWLLSKFT